MARSTMYTPDHIKAMTDEEIVSMALKEHSFFTHLVERYEAKLDRYILRLGIRNNEDREDVLQEIFIKVYRNLNGFDRALSFSSWVYRIAHNEAISWYRKKNVRPEGHLVSEGDEILSLLPEEEESSEAKFDREVNAVELGRALSDLDEKYREVLILRFFEHKEYDEISDILQIPVGSVGTLIHRGKQRLREKINSDAVRI